MSNKHLSEAPSNLVKAKLKVLLESVNDMYSSGKMVTESDISSAYHNAMETFFKSLDYSISNSTSKFMPGQPADPLQYNIFTNALSRDLEALFSEIGALDKIVTSSFNSITATREQILQRSKRISNKLGDYLLYADPSLGAGYFFGDSFNSPERIDSGSSLVETEECFLGQDEGVVLLPLDGSPERPEVSSFTINKTSNGTLGNNAEADIVGKDDLAALGDNEPNTWVEYDKITAYESNSPLLLDLTITLKEKSIINHIHINPINFGTPTPIKILSLETSKDGVEYRSVKDEVPIKDFVAEDEDNEFDLSPATSKYAGQGFYSFLPRKAQYIHVVFEQHTPYSVQTPNGLRLRYAIGLRDINILGRKFKQEGSLVSTQFSNENEIRKVALWASENPIEKSQLADVSHSISNDDGATWYDIQPTSRDSFQVQEVINFNNISSNSITTSSPVDTLRHKIYMNRNTDAFEGNVTVSQEKVSNTDIVNIPSGGSPEVSLTQEPIDSTVKVLLPFWGSYSCPRARAGDEVVGQSYPMELDHVDFNVDVPPIDTLRYALPYKGFANLRSHLRVFVNGEQWEFVNKDDNYLDNASDTSYSSIDTTSKVYYLNRGGAELQFGYTDSSGNVRGALPPTGAKIGVVLDGDNPQLELTDQGYVLTLSASSDGFKENTSIAYFKSASQEEATDQQLELPRGKRSAKMPTLSPVGEDTSTSTSTLSRASSNLASIARASAAARSYAELKAEANSQLYVKPASTTSVGSGQAAAQARTAQANYSSANAKKAGEAYKAYLLLKEEQARLLASEGNGGVLPPVFVIPFSADDPYGNSIRIEEYNRNGDLDTSKDWTPVPFIDGEQELKYQPAPGGAWVYVTNRFSFDAHTGTIYLGDAISSTNKTVFKCKKLEAAVLTSEDWSFYRDPVYDREDSSRILLKPESVHTLSRTLAVTINERSIDLTPNNSKSHDWFNQRVLKGTVQVDPSLFAEGTLPVEVPFVDGATELANTVEVLNEVIEFGSPIENVYSFFLKNITDTQVLVGSPGFGAIRDASSASAPVNIFQTKVTTTPSSNGEWRHIAGNIEVYWDSTPGEHTSVYSYDDNDPGVDIAGLYSVDYLNGVLHLAKAAVKTSQIRYQVSLYSAFYNIAEVIEEGDVKEIDESGKKIIFSTALGMRFLKLDTAAAARPPFMKVVYSYYKKSTESIQDLEPYFSPICKDLAFRAVTADILEEL